MNRNVVITDLDNTLYDWVTFYSKSFSAMLESLSNILQIDEAQLISEFKDINQKYHTIERPFSMFELQSVKDKYNNKSHLELLNILDDASHAFNSMRKQTLRLYDSVADTFFKLKDMGIRIFGCTDSSLETGFYRIMKLGLTEYFSRIYVIDKDYNGHPDDNAQIKLTPPSNMVRSIPRSLVKPDPEIIDFICDQESFNKQNAIYIGDSLIKDILMANQAGITSVWAKYGTEYDSSLWNTLVQITHWTDEELKYNEKLKKSIANIKPSYTINSFKEIITILLESEN